MPLRELNSWKFVENCVAMLFVSQLGGIHDPRKPMAFGGGRSGDVEVDVVFEFSDFGFRQVVFERKD
jgi:hypothetical protein